MTEQMASGDLPVAAVSCHIALGSNLDQPEQQIMCAIETIRCLPAVRLESQASLYRSAPLGYADQPDFINTVIRVSTSLTPDELLAELQGIEQRSGRLRTFSNAPRTLDLDLLLYDQICLNTPELHLPHPRMHQRAFVLLPLLEISPDIRIPGLGAAQDWLAGVSDQAIEKLGTHPA